MPTRDKRSRPASEVFQQFETQCEGKPTEEVALLCRAKGSTTLNAAVLAGEGQSTRNYELGFRYLDKGYAFEINSRDPLYWWAYAQACYYTSRYRLALKLHQLLLQNEASQHYDFFHDAIIQAAVVLKHLENFRQSRDFFCFALRDVPVKYSVESIMV